MILIQLIIVYYAKRKFLTNGGLIMAIAIPNSMFDSFSKRIGNIVLYQRYNTQCMRSYVVPKNPDTIIQRQNRKRFADAVKSWQRLSPDEKYNYTRKARNKGMSGYNLYISSFMKEKEAYKECFIKISEENQLTSSGNLVCTRSVSTPNTYMNSYRIVGKMPDYG
jgi:hypothetical protein